MPAEGIRKGAIKKAPIPAPARSSAYTHAPGLPLFQSVVRKPKTGKAAPHRIPLISIKNANTKVTTAFDFSPDKNIEEWPIIKHNNIMDRNMIVNRTQFVRLFFACLSVTFAPGASPPIKVEKNKYSGKNR